MVRQRLKSSHIEVLYTWLENLNLYLHLFYLSFFKIFIVGLFTVILPNTKSFLKGKESLNDSLNSASVILKVMPFLSI